MVTRRRTPYRERERRATGIIHRDGFISSGGPRARCRSTRARGISGNSWPFRRERASCSFEVLPIVLKGNDAAALRGIPNDLTKIVSAPGNWHRLHDFLKVNSNFPARPSVSLPPPLFSVFRRGPGSKSSRALMKMKLLIKILGRMLGVGFALSGGIKVG